MSRKRVSLLCPVIVCVSVAAAIAVAQDEPSGRHGRAIARGGPIANRVVFLEDYKMTLAQMLAAGTLTPSKRSRASSSTSSTTGAFEFILKARSLLVRSFFLSVYLYQFPVSSLTIVPGADTLYCKVISRSFQ